jgi:hypothetical protein
MLHVPMLVAGVVIYLAPHLRHDRALCDQFLAMQSS